RRARLGREQQHALVAVGAEHQHLGAYGTDLARRGVDDADDEAIDQLGTRGVLDLGRWGPHADLGPEVDAQLPGRTPRLWEVLDLDDPADAHVDAREVLELDEAVRSRRAHGRSVPRRSERYGSFVGPSEPTASTFGIAGERAAV